MASPTAPKTISGIDLSHYRLVASIDFVDMAFHMESIRSSGAHTNFQSVKRQLDQRSSGKPYFVEALDAQYGGGPASHFSARVQDPEHLDAKRWLNEHLPDATGATVHRIEISLDYFPIDGDAAHLGGLAADLLSMRRRQVSDNFRFTGVYKTNAEGKRVKVPGKGTIGIKENANRKDVARLFADDRVLFFGDENSGMTQRWYIKTTDNGGCPLPPSEHRVRVELTLSGEQAQRLGVISPDGAFSFEKAAKYFHVSRPEHPPDATTLIELLDEHRWNQPTAGLRTPRKAPAGVKRKPRMYPHNVKADRAHNERASDALRSLSRRMNRRNALPPEKWREYKNRP